MNIEVSFPDVGRKLWSEHAGLRDDVARIEQIWHEPLAAGPGEFLFGGFSAADAFFAPLCVRISRFALPVSDAARGYIGNVLDAPGPSRWIAVALAEHDFIADDEPCCTSRDDSR